MLKRIFYFLFLNIFILGCKEKELIKPITKPIVKTGDFLLTSPSAVTISGEVVEDGGSVVIERGIVVGKIPNPSFGDLKLLSGRDLGTYSVQLSDLSPGIKYYFRAFATNSIGTSFGIEKEFSTSAILPTLNTISISEITATGAKLGGEITNDGGSPITEKGICISLQPNPTVTDRKILMGIGSDPYSKAVDSLEINKQYYVRAYAKNSVGIAYGQNVGFSTLSYVKGNGMYDNDKNFYKTVIINGKEWMAENLRTNYINDGRLISQVWANNSENWGKVCIGSTSMTEPLVFFRSEQDAEKFGHLYSWHAAQLVCPTGWRLPTGQDFDSLINYLGGYAIAGSKMKDNTPNLWNTTTSQGSNSSGFSARPAGNFARTSLVESKLINQGISVQFWSTSSLGFQTQCPDGYAPRYELRSNSQEVNVQTFFGCECTKSVGRSVRCIKSN
jgi:uncharacterized protein (TIGR02145 family)